MIRLAVLTLILMAAGNALAAGPADRTGFAVNGSIGASQIRDTDGEDRFNGNGFGWMLGVEYRFVPHFALAMNAFSLGRAEDVFGGEPTKINAGGIDLAGRFILPVSETIELYGVIGRARYYTNVNPGGLDFFGESAWEFGLGMDIDMTEKLSLRIDARYFDGADAEYGALATVGVAYRF